MNTSIQKLLQEIQVTTGWSQPHIAREIGTSQPTVNRILKGQGECKASTWQAIVNLSERIKSYPDQHASHGTDDPHSELDRDRDSLPSRKNLLECGINQSQPHERAR